MTTFKNGDLITHPAHGDGVVSRDTHGRWIVCVFDGSDKETFALRRSTKLRAPPVTKSEVARAVAEKLGKPFVNAHLLPMSSTAEDANSAMASGNAYFVDDTGSVTPEQLAAVMQRGDDANVVLGMEGMAHMEPPAADTTSQNAFLRRADVEALIGTMIKAGDDRIERLAERIVKEVDGGKSSLVKALAQDLDDTVSRMSAYSTILKRLDACEQFTLTETRLGPDAILRDRNGQTAIVK